MLRDNALAPIARADRPAGGRLHFLDALRGIAALSVFCYHAGAVLALDQLRPLYDLINLGSFGVVLFFLCSGFIIPVSIEREGSLRVFWVRRFFRLFPLYWASVALYAALGLLLGRGEAAADVVANPWPIILANLTMFQQVIGQPHLMYGYWTLLFEMLFYLLVSALFFARLLRRTELLTVGLCLTALLAETALPLATGRGKPVLGLATYLAVMMLGTLLARVHAGAVTWRRAAPVVALAAVTMVVTALGKPDQPGGLLVFVDFLVARVAALAVFLTGMALRSRRVPAPLRWLGEVSYSIYLLHVAVIATLWLGSGAVTALAWLAATLLLAAASHRWVELPAIRLGRHLSRSEAPLPEAAAGAPAPRSTPIA